MTIREETVADVEAITEVTLAAFKALHAYDDRRKRLHQISGLAGQV